MKKLTILIIVVALAWIAWPYFSAYRLANAIAANDKVHIEEAVAWESVRSGFKDDFNALLAKETAKSTQAGTENNVFAGLATAIMPALVNNMVDAYVTPAGLAGLVNQGTNSLGNSDGTTTPEQEPKIQWDRVEYAFFKNPTTFLIEISNPDDPESAGLKLLMKFQDFGWRLTRVFLPIDELSLPN